jgi:hypothetical protein
MRRTIAVLLIAAMTAGCLATQQTVPASIIKKLGAVIIVAVEAPPLLLHPKTDADHAAIAAVGLASPGGGGGANAGYLVLLPLFGPIGTAVIYGLASSTPRSGETATLVRDSAPWMPTTGLAKSAARLLQNAGAREAVVIDGYAQLPITDRSVNKFLENWMAAERRWYNADVSMLDYTQLGSLRSDAILEVGVSNYEYVGSRLVMQVHVKLSDPTTKQVLGRARNAEWPTAQPLAVMLRDRGEPLRRLIETTGELLLARCLADVGLISR